MRQVRKTKAKDELRYYFDICIPQHLWPHSFSLSVYKSVYVGLFARYQIRNVQLQGGGCGYVGATRWHTGKEVTTATWLWLNVHMMPVKNEKKLATNVS